MSNNPPLTNEQIQALIEKEQISVKPTTKANAAPVPKSKNTGMMEPETVELNDIEKKIRQIQKGSEFKMKLSAPQIARVAREAEALNLDWRDYLKKKITDTLLEGTVGRSVVTGPSFAKAGKIKGPSKFIPNRTGK